MFQAGIEETPSRVLVYFARQRNARSFMCLNYYPRSLLAVKAVDYVKQNWGMHKYGHVRLMLP